MGLTKIRSVFQKQAQEFNHLVSNPFAFSYWEYSQHAPSNLLCKIVLVEFLSHGVLLCLGRLIATCLLNSS